jgi:hypothetical protein
MAKYTFSQGKVRVERGVYHPVLNKATGEMPQTGVLLLVIARTTSSETVPQGKENKTLIHQKE